MFSFLVVFLAGLLTALVSSISYSVAYDNCNNGHSESKKAGRKAAWRLGVPTFLLVASAISVISYYHNSKELYGLNTQISVQIPNEMAFLKDMNRLVVVHSDQKNLIVDVANLGQSVRNTQEWKGLLGSVDYYNHQVTEWMWMRENPTLALFMGGPYPAIPDTLRFVKFNDLTK
jgi:hypothetical protein